MNKIILFADATADIPANFIKENNIQIIGLRYSVGDTDGWYTCADDQSQFDEFYSKMRKGETAHTSLVLYDDAAVAFEPFFKQGFDIIHLGLSSGLAKTYENALNAGNDLAKKYGRKFYAPDSKTVSGQNYIIMRNIISLTKKYQDCQDIFEKITAELPQFYKRVKAFFTVEDLKYLHKSGRLSGAAAFLGGILNIKPIIIPDKNGKLVSITKKTGRSASIQFIANQINTYDPEVNEAFIIHADCTADAKLLEQKILEIKPEIKTEIINMGFIIGTHTGPGAVGVGFVGADK
jgi:DegV family protein with EDD domain